MNQDECQRTDCASYKSKDNAKVIFRSILFIYFTVK